MSLGTREEWVASSLATDGSLRDNGHVGQAAAQPTVRWKRGGTSTVEGIGQKIVKLGWGDGMGGIVSRSVKLVE